MTTIVKIKDLKVNTISPTSKSLFNQPYSNKILNNSNIQNSPTANTFFKTHTKSFQVNQSSNCKCFNLVYEKTESVKNSVDGLNKVKSDRVSFLIKKENYQITSKKNFDKPVILIQSANSKVNSINNISDKMQSVKNELLNLRKEYNFECDFESKRMINRNNLSAFSPRKVDDYKKFITNTLGIFKNTTEIKTSDNEALANRIFNRNKSPLKGETDSLTNTFKKQNKIENSKAKNDLFIKVIYLLREKMS